MTDNVESIDRKKPHVAVLALCLPCKHKWLAVAPVKTHFFLMQCPRCKERDSWVTFIPSWYMDLQ